MFLRLPPQESLIQVSPLRAAVFPEFTQKRQPHPACNTSMSNGIFPNLLETTLQDSLDGRENFTLQMAYIASASDTQPNILSIGDTADNDLPEKPTPLTLVNAVIINETVSNHQSRHSQRF